MIKLHLPVTTASVGTAFNMPIDDIIERLRASARELDAAAKNVPGKREVFGQKLTQAAKAKLRSRSRHTVAAASDEAESFGEKLKKAVQKKLGQRARRVI